MGFGIRSKETAVPFERKRSFIRKEQTGLLWDGRSGFSSLFFPFGLDTNFLDLAFRFLEGGEEKAFTPCLMREEAVNRMFKPEGAGDLPFLLGRDRQCLGSQLLYYIMYVLLILFRIIGTCTVDQDTSGFQGVPDIMDDAPPTGGAKSYVIYAPFACAIRIFPEHALTGTRYVGDDHVEQMRQCLADLLRVIIDNDRVRAAPFSDILGQYITPAADHLIAH